MKIFYKILAITVIVLSIFTFIYPQYATPTSSSKGKTDDQITKITDPLYEESGTKGASAYVPSSGNEELSENSPILKLANVIVGIIRSIGTIISVAVLMGLGIKYMIGSMEEKAEYKEKLIPYIIGCLLLFMLSQFINIIWNFVNESGLMWGSNL